MSCTRSNSPRVFHLESFQDLVLDVQGNKVVQLSHVFSCQTPHRLPSCQLLHQGRACVTAERSRQSCSPVLAGFFSMMDGYTGGFFISILEMEMDHLMSCLFCESFCGIHVSDGTLYAGSAVFDLGPTIRSPTVNSEQPLPHVFFVDSNDFLALPLFHFLEKQARGPLRIESCPCRLHTRSSGFPSPVRATTVPNTTSRLLSSIILK